MPICNYIEDRTRVVGTRSHTRTLFSSFGKRHGSLKIRRKSTYEAGPDQLARLLEISFLKTTSGRTYIMIPVDSIPAATVQFVEQNANFTVSELLTPEQLRTLSEKEKPDTSEISAPDKEVKSAAGGVISKLKQQQEAARESGELEDPSMSGVPEDEVMDLYETEAMEDSDDDELETIADFTQESGHVDENEERQSLEDADAKLSAGLTVEEVLKEEIKTISGDKEDDKLEDDDNFLNELAEDQEANSEQSLDDALMALRGTQPVHKPMPEAHKKGKGK